MADYVARERLYHTLDRSEVVKEGDPRGAFLIAGVGDVIPESEAKRLKLEGHLERAQAVDPTERTKARLEDALNRGAYEEALSHKQALERNELAVQSGGPERAALEAGRSRALTGTVPTPPVESRSRAVARADEAAQEPVHKTAAPAPASSSSASSGAKK